MASFEDEVLGTVSVRHNYLSHSIRVRLSPRGEIVVTAPTHTPMIFIKQTIKNMRSELEEMRTKSRIEHYESSQQIGQSHKLIATTNHETNALSAIIKNRIISVTIPDSRSIDDADVQNIIRENVAKALRKEAKSYLPRRLKTLADRYGYTYETVRLPHAISRWGSCSSNGTISLNIALMKLPLDLIDYVIVHELSHTKYMNHSREFWREVGRHDPDYTLHRNQIKAYTPII